jgi:hypothetical protein
LFTQVKVGLQSVKQLDSPLPGLSWSSGWPLVFSLVWAMIAGFGMIGLFRNRIWAGTYSQWVLAGFVLYMVLRVYILARADYDRQRLPFLVVSGLLSLVGMFVVWLVGRHRRQKLAETSNDR